jgi:hypothetical protein
LGGQRVVVKFHNPRRARLVAVVAVGLALLLAVGIFELGQRTGGASSFRSDERRLTLRSEARQLRAENQKLKEELATARTSLEVDRETQLLLTETLAASEARLAELNEELAFYRRIVSPTDGQQGLRVQAFEVTNNRDGNDDHSYRLRLLLVQSPQRSGRAQGRLDLSLRGTLHGEEAKLKLQDLAAEPQNYEFLYFQDVDLDVVLPAGFEPEAAEVELKPGQGNARAIAASFPWKPRG